MHMPGTHKRQTSSLLLLTVACCTCCAAAAYSESIFSKANQYPVVWWAVNGPDIPGLANNALAMRSDTADAEAFSQDVIVSLAKGQRTRTAKAIGYMINANSTYGGGCPNPAPPVNILQRFGRAFAAAILAGDDQESLWGSPLAEVVAGLDTPNVTEASLRAVNGSVVADTMLGGLFAAARSCTQPNALTGSSQAAVVAKYVDATCFYAGHILRGLTSNSTRHIGSFDRTLAADIRLANSTDPYVTSPVLQAFQKCQSGPASVLRPPSWLGQAFAQVSIDESSKGALNGNDGSISGGGIISEGSISGLTIGGSTSSLQNKEAVDTRGIFERTKRWRERHVSPIAVAGR